VWRENNFQSFYFQMQWVPASGVLTVWLCVALIHRDFYTMSTNMKTRCCCTGSQSSWRSTGEIPGMSTLPGARRERGGSVLNWLQAPRYISSLILMWPCDLDLSPPDLKTGSKVTLTSILHSLRLLFQLNPGLW